MSLTVQCRDCPDEFTVEDGEINFLKEKFGDDFTPPVRCKPCRKNKKARNNARGSQPPDFSAQGERDMFTEAANRDDGQRHAPRTGRKSRGQTRKRY